MSLYRDVILPPLMDKAMKAPDFVPVRRRVAGAAEGRVLEVGIAGGTNLAYYGDKVTELFGLDPDRRALGYLRRRAEQAPFPVTPLPAGADSIPLDTGSVDCIVTTLTVCSLPDHDAAMAELRRVLKPGGVYLFGEHGLAPDPKVQRWQHRLTPCCRVLGGGCHINYAIDRAIGERGFRIDRLDTGYAGKNKAATYVYEGAATPA